MFKSLKTLAVAAAVVAAGSMAQADGHAGTSWTLDGENSKLAFGSIKKDTVGETHSFGAISGSVLPDGTVSIEVDLASVETNIDIRNERMIEHVFKGIASATLTASIDMDEVNALEIGGMTVVDAEGVLGFLGASVEIEAEMFVARISETTVLVTTNDMIFVGAEDLGISPGIDKLMELASLPGITRTTPVTMRLIFNADEQKAEAAPAAPVSVETTTVALIGDTAAGKKVFRKCKACHTFKEGKNGAGPTLHKVLGATAGQVGGFKFSNEMTASGIVWNAETLAGFLAKPKAYLPGTKMSFAGLKKQADIDNVIAYIAEESGE
ncbi:cytochrome c family protein [Litoreibacter sp.]|nr:cytochrome c family protein [Litoreibacter sp.]